MGAMGSPVEVEKHASMDGGHELGLQNGCPHTKQKAVFNTTCMQALLYTAKNTRHCFHGVVNLTNVCSTQAHGED